MRLLTKQQRAVRLRPWRFLVQRPNPISLRLRGIRHVDKAKTSGVGRLAILVDLDALDDALWCAYLAQLCFRGRKGQIPDKKAHVV